MQIYTKFANFTGLYFPHFTTIRNQTLQFYSFEDALSSYGNGFHSSCLDQNFVYSWNDPLRNVTPITHICSGLEWYKAASYRMSPRYCILREESWMFQYVVQHRFAVTECLNTKTIFNKRSNRYTLKSIRTRRWTSVTKLTLFILDSSTSSKLFFLEVLPLIIVPMLLQEETYTILILFILDSSISSKLLFLEVQ
jgi:hypothetical protein